jgi:hypothetical protein
LSHIETFTIADPADFDGTPYEVAERAVAQLEGLALILQEALEPAERMARNAEMTRRIDLGQEPEGDRWPEMAMGRQWAKLADEVEFIGRRLSLMKRAAGFNPKAPING